MPGAIWVQAIQLPLSKSQCYSSAVFISFSWWLPLLSPALWCQAKSLSKLKTYLWHDSLPFKSMDHAPLLLACNSYSGIVLSFLLTTVTVFSNWDLFGWAPFFTNPNRKSLRASFFFLSSACKSPRSCSPNTKCTARPQISSSSLAAVT